MTQGDMREWNKSSLLPRVRSFCVRERENGNKNNHAHARRDQNELYMRAQGRPGAFCGRWILVVGSGSLCNGENGTRRGHIVHETTTQSAFRPIDQHCSVTCVAAVSVQKNRNKQSTSRHPRLLWFVGE